MDMELKRAFTELQKQVVNSNQKLQLKDLLINQISRIKRENENTLNEFTKMSDDMNVYESVGRAFVFTDFKKMKQNLNEENKQIEKKVAELENDKQVITRSINLSKENLRDLVDQKKNL